MHAEDEDVVTFLRIITQPGNQPIFIHCQHGSDRTGMMCAIYRIAQQHWTNAEALREMTTGGYGFHPIWKDIATFVREFDAKTVAP